MTGKRHHFCILLLSLTLVGCSNSFDCTDYKTGRFVTFSPVARDRIVIERTASFQIETDARTGSVMRNKIVWKSPCEYEMIVTSTNKVTSDGIDSFFAITPIKVRIIGGNKNYYVFNARVDSANKFVELTDTMRILK